jgi:hypothetical protein
MVSARARVLTRPDRMRCASGPPCRPSTASQQSPAQQAGTLYAAIHGLLQLRDLAGAEAMLPCLQALTQGDAAAQRQTLWLAAELALAAERPQQALQRLEQLPPAPSSTAPQSGGGTHNAAAARPGPVDAAPQRGGGRRPADLGDHPRMRPPGRPWPAPRANPASHCVHCGPRPKHPSPTTTTRRPWTASRPASNWASAAVPRRPLRASIIDTRLRAVQALLREQTAQR